MRDQSLLWFCSLFSYLLLSQQFICNAKPIHLASTEANLPIPTKHNSLNTKSHYRNETLDYDEMSYGPYQAVEIVTLIVILIGTLTSTGLTIWQIAKQVKGDAAKKDSEKKAEAEQAIRDNLEQRINPLQSPEDPETRFSGLRMAFERPSGFKLLNKETEDEIIETFGLRNLRMPSERQEVFKSDSVFDDNFHAAKKGLRLTEADDEPIF